MVPGKLYSLLAKPRLQRASKSAIIGNSNMMQYLANINYVSWSNYSFNLLGKAVLPNLIAGS